MKKQEQLHEQLRDFFQGANMSDEEIASIAAEVEQREAQLQLEYQGMQAAEVEQREAQLLLEYQGMQAAENEQFYQDHPEYTYETWK